MPPVYLTGGISWTGGSDFDVHSSMNYHTNISSILYNSRVIIRLLACTFATIFPPRMATSVFTTASPNPVLPLCLDLSPV